jgi:inhibitor of cysteine peptidase
MEKEIKKKASVYGIAAIILAIMLGTLCYNFGPLLDTEPSPTPSPASHFTLLSTFSSEDALRNYLMANSHVQGTYPYYGPWDAVILKSEVQAFGAPSASLNLFSSSDAYSTTNVQVAGVDEADLVKTDGEYIYVMSNNSVFILKAYPPEQAKVLSKIVFKDTYAVEIFVSGDRLAVLECKYGTPQIFPLWGYYRPFTVDIKTRMEVYNISDRANPAFLTDFTISGSYFNSRMIGDYVYFVVSQPAYIIYDTAILPKIYTPRRIMEIPASQIQYFNTSDDYYQYTTIAAMNIQNISQAPTYATILLGGTSNMYVSLKNIYITFEFDGQTSIYRIRIENGTLDCEARGKVQGRELNQFSMDEHNGYFRIATSSWLNGNPQTNLYVLDMNLNVVGSLEGIAANETMDSARFMDDRCYLSTSVVRRDPFFVIDVQNASEPKILGYLKIPGFIRYLHPYDEDHVIGVGRDENSKVKITLFDVTNVSAPINMSNYTVEGIWSDTPVLSDHKAFLFDRSKDLLVIPVSINFNNYELNWQGAYVFNITLTDGLDLRGNVMHQSDTSNNWYYSYYVKRAFYAEDALYTMSDTKILINSLEDLHLLKEVPLF